MPGLLAQDFADIKADNFVERSSRILSFQTPESRDIKSLQNWLHGTCCLAREEASYLINRRELMSLAPPKDTATSKLESWAEDQLIWLCRGFRKVRYNFTLLQESNHL